MTKRPIKPNTNLFDWQQNFCILLISIWCVFVSFLCIQVCVCVCVWKKEREKKKVCVFVCVCVHSYASGYEREWVWLCVYKCERVCTQLRDKERNSKIIS